MAKIYPSDIDLNVAKSHSYAEWKVLCEIMELPESKTKGWQIFYSYQFRSKDSQKRYLEIDFLFLIPGWGVFDLEIKGGRIELEEGCLITVNKKGERNKIHPYQQAKENFYAIMSTIDKTLGTNLKDKIYGGGLVYFPDCSRPHGIQLLQSNGYDTLFANEGGIYDFLERNIGFDRHRKPNGITPDEKTIERIIDVLMGTGCDFRLRLSDYIAESNLCLNQLTEEQTTILRSLRDNERCLVYGAAGTGKTVLAQFLARNLILEKKRKVLYLTFNRLISDRVNADKLFQQTDSKCYPFFDYLQTLYRQAGLPLNEIPDAFSKKNEFLLEKCKWLLLEESEKLGNVKYDCLIIDEAQDFTDDGDLLEILGSFVNGGLEDGFIYLFYDRKQKIFNKKERPIYENEVFDKARYARFELTKNCRNIESIKVVLESLLNEGTNVEKALRKIDSSSVIVESGREDETTAKRIEGVVRDLLKQGVKAEQITLLSELAPYNEKNVIMDYLRRAFGGTLSDLAKDGKVAGKVSFATVHAYKGLENDIIVFLRDLSFLGTKELYVAISRAKFRAYVFDVYGN